MRQRSLENTEVHKARLKRGINADTDPQREVKQQMGYTSDYKDQ